MKTDETAPGAGGVVLSAWSDEQFYREFNRRRLCQSRSARPSDLRSVETDPPPHFEMVVLWLSMPANAIDFAPVTAKRDWTPGVWWSGVPGQWQRLDMSGWTIEGWTPLPSTVDLAVPA